MHRQRSSVRSRGSSSSPDTVNPRKQIKDCCRNTVAFMCTQVGVGALIVAYALIGAASFISIETNSNNTNNNYIDIVATLRNRCATNLWRHALRNNVFDEIVWKQDVDNILKIYQNNMTNYIHKGYDGRSPKEVWTFPAALMYSMSVFSMIGYGNMVPRTEWGKGVTVIYATFGIPLYILYFLNIGKVLAKTFRWTYTWIHQCCRYPDDELYIQEEWEAKKYIVPSTACLWVMSVYIFIGTMMFAHWENWNYLDAVYFCVTSLCKIGIGDFVPGTTSNHTISVLGLQIQDTHDEKQTKLVINFVYMLFGMGLVAMCYNLMGEDVRVKMKEIKEDMLLCMEDIRLRFARCCGGGNNGKVYQDHRYINNNYDYEDELLC